jgi:hypothetical protein
MRNEVFRKENATKTTPLSHTSQCHVVTYCSVLPFFLSNTPFSVSHPLTLIPLPPTECSVDCDCDEKQFCSMESPYVQYDGTSRART